MRGVRYITEATPKLYRDNPPIGRAKHSIDILERDIYGSMFWGIRVFKTKREKESYVKNLQSEGYKTFGGVLEDVHKIVDKLGLTNPESSR